MQEPKTRTSADQGEFKTAQLLQTALLSHLQVGLELEVKETKTEDLTQLPNALGSKSEITCTALQPQDTIQSPGDADTQHTPSVPCRGSEKRKEPSRAVKIHDIFKGYN